MTYRTETKTIERLKRLPVSSMGNPAWHVFFTDGTDARTSSNAGWSYEAENRENIGVPLEVHFTKAGRIAYCRRTENL